MRMRLWIALLLGLVAAAVLWHRDILRLLRAWGRGLNTLLQTNLDAYPVEDPTWTIAERAQTSAERQAERIERTKRQLGNPADTSIPFGVIWNWVRRSHVRRAVQRNGHESVSRTAF